MQVIAVRDLDGLRALENDWQAVHLGDPHASIFGSWAWLHARLDSLNEGWRVLVARADGVTVGLLPLRLTGTDEEPILTLAGSPLADDTGFLCLPEREQAVMTAFADHLRQHLRWQRLELRDVVDPRLAGFLALFPQPEFQIDRLPPTPCPRLPLPATWEQYLATALNGRRRQTLRRQLRTIEALPALRFSTVADGGEAQIAILLRLWQGRWGVRPEAELEQFRAVFRSCLEAGLLWLDILWSGDEPLAGLLAFLDQRQGRFCFYISGYDEGQAAWSPGTVMVARSIRAAIDMGFRSYDFLRGNEPYKFSFGARPSEAENVDIVRLVT